MNVIYVHSHVLFPFRAACVYLCASCICIIITRSSIRRRRSIVVVSSLSSSPSLFVIVTHHRVSRAPFVSLSFSLSLTHSLCLSLSLSFVISHEFLLTHLVEPVELFVHFVFHRACCSKDARFYHLLHARIGHSSPCRHDAMSCVCVCACDLIRFRVDLSSCSLCFFLSFSFFSSSGQDFLYVCTSQHAALELCAPAFFRIFAAPSSGR